MTDALTPLNSEQAQNALKQRTQIVKMLEIENNSTSTLQYCNTLIPIYSQINDEYTQYHRVNFHRVSLPKKFLDC